MGSYEELKTDLAHIEPEHQEEMAEKPQPAEIQRTQRLMSIQSTTSVIIKIQIVSFKN